MCRLYSSAISETIKNGGPHAAKTSAVKALRTVSIDGMLASLQSKVSAAY